MRFPAKTAVQVSFHSSDRIESVKSNFFPCKFEKRKYTHNRQHDFFCLGHFFVSDQVHTTELGLQWSTSMDLQYQFKTVISCYCYAFSTVEIKCHSIVPNGKFTWITKCLCLHKGGTNAFSLVMSRSLRTPYLQTCTAIWYFSFNNLFSPFIVYVDIWRRHLKN